MCIDCLLIAWVFVQVYVYRLFVDCLGVRPGALSSITCAVVMFRECLCHCFPHLSQTLHGTAIYADQLTPLAPRQLIGSPMTVPWVVFGSCTRCLCLLWGR